MSLMRKMTDKGIEMNTFDNGGGTRYGDSLPTFTERNASETIFDILLHIALISLVLQIGFSVFLQKLEQRATNTEIKNALKTILKESLEDYRSEISKIHPDWVESMEVFFENDDYFNNANDLVKQKNWMFIIMLIFSTILFLLTMKYMCRTKGMGHGILKTIGGNLALLVLVGCIEGYFILEIMLNFVPTKPSLMSETVIDRLKKFDNDKTIKNCFIESCPPKLPQYLIILGYFVPVISLIGLTVLLSKLKNNQYFKNRRLPDKINFPGILWQGAFVAIVVSGAFLTLGKKQEELVLTSTLNKIVDTYVGTLYKSIEKTSPDVADIFMKKLQTLEKPDMTDDDANVKYNNNKMVKKAIYMCLVVVGIALVVHILTITLSKKKEMRLFRKQNIKFVFISALIAACCSFLSEFNFMVAVAAKAEPISVNEVGTIALNVVKDDIKKC